MARPVKVPVLSGTPGWDASVNANADTIFDGPLPLYEAVDAATLATDFDATQYDNCIAYVTDTDSIYISDGTTWILRSQTLPYDGSPTATTLRDALITAGLMAAS